MKDSSSPSRQSQSTEKGNRWIEPAAGAHRPDLTTEELETLSRDTGWSVATLRGAGSFYADNKWRNEENAIVQVCDGTSCRLGGGKLIEAILRRYGHEYQKVYCLGFCDRSPVSMVPYDQMREHTPTSIRNLAPKPIVTQRILNGSVREIEKAIDAGVYQGLIRAFKKPPMNLIGEVEKSGERGRGGAGFPTGKKWRTAAESESEQKYVIANGDEGDPGSFLDRVLMEQDPHTIIEGMTLCGYAIGATEGIVYIRSEYPRAVEVMHEAIAEAQREGYLGENICGSGFSFDVRVFIGKGSYVCGEETALIASLEGLRGEVQLRPPYPAQVGLHGKPTIVNNVETLSNIPLIALNGGDEYSTYGTHSTSGTKALCLNHGFENPGLVEVEFGITFREVIEEIGGGGRGGEPLAAVLVGGPMGTLLQPKDWDFPICYEVLKRQGIELGHGGFVAVPEGANFRDLLIHLTEFMIRESCGKCVPCRLGSQAFLKVVEENRPISELEEMLDAIEAGSLCAFGQFVPGPLRSLLSNFSEQVFGDSSETA